MSDQIVKWCELLESSDAALRKALLPSLFHLAIMSLVNGGDSTLFKEILSSVKNVDPSESEAEIFSLGMAMVLSLRDKSTLERALSTIVDIIHQIAADTGEEESEVIVPVLLDKAGPCLKKSLQLSLVKKKEVLPWPKLSLGYRVPLLEKVYLTS